MMNQELISSAKEIAIEVGDLLLEMFNDRLGVNLNKKGVKDIVTDADIKAEKLIKSRLLSKFPDITVISEESDMEKEHVSFETGNFWVIDPLDGTRNFSIGNPNFVISIGYVDENMGFHGVVYYPILNQIFYTQDGKSYCNDKQIIVSSLDLLEPAIVAFWDKREKDPDWNQPDILNLLRGKVSVIRMFGASALEKSWVANGQIDLYIGNSSSIFGAVAGIALIRSAGGVALNLEGEEWRLGDVGVICGNKDLVHDALQYLK